MKIKGTKLLLLLCLILSGIAISSATYLSKNKRVIALPTKDEFFKINTAPYNAIVYAIDSFSSAISNHEKQKKAAENENKRIRQEKESLTKQCEEQTKIAKSDTTKTPKDSTQAIIKPCEVLKTSTAAWDKSISKNDSIFKSETSICLSLDKQRKIQETKLLGAIERLRNEAKKVTGAVKIDFRGTIYYAFIANTDIDTIQMHWKRKDKDGKNFLSIGNVLSYLQSQKKNPVMITNAGMYTPNFEPQGLFIDGQGNKLRPLDISSPRTDANFYLKPNGVFFVDTLGKSHIETTEEFQKNHDTTLVAVKYATQSGPMLLNNGSIHKGFTAGSPNRKIRSGVGQINSTNSVFIISKDEANFYDFALLFKDVFDCKDALFLDGAISMMYLKDIDSNSLGGQFGPIISITTKK